MVGEGDPIWIKGDVLKLLKDIQEEAEEMEKDFGNLQGESLDEYEHQEEW